jgi:hypothetical protein
MTIVKSKPRLFEVWTFQELKDYCKDKQRSCDNYFHFAGDLEIKERESYFKIPHPLYIGSDGKIMRSDDLLVRDIEYNSLEVYAREQFDKLFEPELFKLQ